MTGAGHWAKAQRLLSSVELDDTGIVYDEASSGTVATIAKAQVHATLALASATAVLIPEKDSSGYNNSSMIRAWHEAGAW